MVLPQSLVFRFKEVNELVQIDFGSLWVWSYHHSFVEVVPLVQSLEASAEVLVVLFALALVA